MIAQALIKRGASMEAENDFGETSLFIAASKDNELRHETVSQRIIHY